MVFIWWASELHLLTRDQSTCDELMKGDYLSRLATHCPLPELYRRDDFCMLTEEQLAIVGERQKERDDNKAKPAPSQAQTQKSKSASEWWGPALFLAFIIALQPWGFLLLGFLWFAWWLANEL